MNQTSLAIALMTVNVIDRADIGLVQWLCRTKQELVLLSKDHSIAMMEVRIKVLSSIISASFNVVIIVVIIIDIK